MPHIIVKLYNGKSEQEKKELSAKIVKDVVESTGCTEASVSLAVQEYAPEDWAEKVFRPDIMDCPGRLYKSPGYDPYKGGSKKEEQVPDLMAYVRGAAERAAAEDGSGMFNPMAWLDQELEDNPGTFNPFFDTPWDELADSEKADRMTAVRRVL